MNALKIVKLGEAVLSGHLITYDEALALTAIDPLDIPLLAAYAHKIRAKFVGSHVDMCGVISARSGMCSEDCKFCAQSVHHTTNAPVYDLMDTEALVAIAQKAEQQGARRISVVTSGKGMEHDPAFSKIIEAIKQLLSCTRLQICANLGTITAQQARQLAAAGVKRYAHNLETSERYYPAMCSTHPYSDRVSTIQAAKNAGMELCTGGIIGLGENWRDRIAMAFTLKELDVHSVPINILNPIKGTPLENQPPLLPLEIIQTFALFRFILPAKVIRPAGGREINLRDMQGAIMLAGANGLIVGNYLTFTGRDTAADFKMVRDAQLVP